MGSYGPGQPTFWFVMSLALLTGFLLAYPINWWLVTRHLKHGMMTVRPPAPTLAPAAPESHLTTAPRAAMAVRPSSDHAHVEKAESQMEPVSRRVQLRVVVLTFGVLALSIGAVALVGWL